ncbi:MAG TPA: DNA primase [Pirellulales bacterium]|nr:DNA primase [Pirellulales bacterium]
MSFGVAFDAKERVRQAIDIVELAGSYLQLRREGRIYKALCPWHDDSRPSLQINPERQSFKCWVCDIGGDIFSFLMKIENVSFAEAMAMLAERAGVDLRPPKADGATSAGSTASASPSPDDKRLLYQAAAWVEQQYHHFLVDAPEAEIARRYFDARGISEQSISRFRLGFAPNQWEWLLSRARNTPYTAKVLQTIGVIGQRPNGPGYYDRFKGRVLFSIRDQQGRPVALGGRVLPEFQGEGTAKYVNSPETPLFSKSNLLYAFDQAKDAISKSHVAMVMEGYTDALIAQQFGFQNAVACLGTALGERHIRLLKRFANSILLVLDGDEAGQKRTNEILDLFVAEQVDLRILTLPEEFDPCEFLLERGAAAFQALLDTAVDALEHKLRTVTRGVDLLRDTHRANLALEEVLATLAKAPRQDAQNSSGSKLREQQILARLARDFRVREEELRQRLGALRRGQTSRQARFEESSAGHDAAANPFHSASLHAWERELLEIVLIEPEAISQIAEQLAWSEVSSAGCRTILRRCCELSQRGITPDFNRLILEFDEPEAKHLLVELDETSHAKGDVELALRLQEVLSSFRRRAEDRERLAVLAPLQDRRVADGEAEFILQQLIEQQRSRQGISAPTDG